jgi:hypothetical protein
MQLLTLLIVAASCTHPLDAVKVYVQHENIVSDLNGAPIQTNANLGTGLRLPASLNNFCHSLLHLAVWLS